MIKLICDKCNFEVILKGNISTPISEVDPIKILGLKKKERIIALHNVSIQDDEFLLCDKHNIQFTEFSLKVQREHYKKLRDWLGKKEK